MGVLTLSRLQKAPVPVKKTAAPQKKKDSSSSSSDSDSDAKGPPAKKTAPPPAALKKLAPAKVTELSQLDIHRSLKLKTAKARKEASTSLDAYGIGLAIRVMQSCKL